MRRLFVMIMLVVLVCPAGNAQKGKIIRVLIVDGFSNHDWRQTTRATKYILEKSGLFSVSVATVPSDSTGKERWNPEFGQYAVIIQNTNNINNIHWRWPRRVEQQLEEFVNNGGGLYVLHSGNNAFAHWAAYDTLIGLGWRPVNFGYALEIDSAENMIRIPPGQGWGTGHGDRFNAVVERLTQHPINKGYPDKWKTADTEVYYYPRGTAENLTVLSYAYDSVSTKKRWPLEWIVKYGKGNIYTSSLGHLWQGETYPLAYRCVGFQTTMIRVTEWLATGKVTYPVPANFPTASEIRLFDEETF